MKKCLVITLSLLLLVTLAAPVFAKGGGFAPSVGYKDGPEIDHAEIDRKDPNDHDHKKEDARPCLVITTVIQAQNKTTDISQAERDTLLDLYGKMTNNEVEMPQPNDWVVRELVDVSWSYSGCVENEHGKEEWMKEEGNTLTVTLKTGIPASVEVSVYVFINGNWEEVELVSHSENGALTCIFEDIGPVAICVREDAEIPPPQTGDAVGRILWIWVLMLVISLGAVTALLLNRRKFLR